MRAPCRSDDLWKKIKKISLKHLEVLENKETLKHTCSQKCMSTHGHTQTHHKITHTHTHMPTHSCGGYFRGKMQKLTHSAPNI